MVAGKSPLQRAQECLTFLTHETGSATVRVHGLTLADISIDLEQRLADAIADAEDDLCRQLDAKRAALGRLPLLPRFTVRLEHRGGHLGWEALIEEAAADGKWCRAVDVEATVARLRHLAHQLAGYTEHKASCSRYERPPRSLDGGPGEAYYNGNLPCSCGLAALTEPQSRTE